MSIIRVIDFEGGGKEPPADIVEFGWCDLDPVDGTIGAPQSCLHGLTRPMEPEARAVHHIRPDELAGLPLFDAETHIAAAAADDAIILAAHAWDLYEGKWFTTELLEGRRLWPLCAWKAALRVWPDAPSHSNGALRYWLEDQGLVAPEWSLTQPAHRAAPDAYVTAHLIKALLNHATAREMVAWTREPALYPTCPIGKTWRGKKWADVDGGFLKWMLDQRDMEEDLKWNARRELDRRAMDQRVAP